MAHEIVLWDRKVDNEGDAKKAYNFDPEDKISDLKRRVAEEEGEDVDDIHIFLAFCELADTDLVRDYANRDEGLYVHYQGYGSEFTATGGNVHVWFGKERCFMLTADTGETVTPPFNGHCAVIASSNVNQEDKETFYQARLYKVRNNQKYEVKVDSDGNTTLWQKTKDGEKKEDQKDLKNYVVHYQGRTTMQNLEIAHSVVDLIGKVINWANPLRGCIQVPSGTSQ
eukprot:00599.XXX_978_1736_1 [CDS] Oithona nana genome sequencing.